MELDNDQPYNAHFTIKELKIALNSKKNSAPGADTIHYKMLKQLPERNKYTLLKLINKSWERGAPHRIEGEYDYSPSKTK